MPCVESQSVWEWEALGEMQFGFLKKHEACVSLVGNGRSMQKQEMGIRHFLPF